MNTPAKYHPPIGEATDNQRVKNCRVVSEKCKELLTQLPTDEMQIVSLIKRFSWLISLAMIVVSHSG